MFSKTRLVHPGDWRDSLHDYIDFLAHKHSVDRATIRQELLADDIPAQTYDCELTPLQATAKYLDRQSRSTREIAQQLGRSTSEVGKLLREASGSLGAEEGPRISSSVFADRALTASEHLVEELQKHGLSVNEIADTLGKSPQTIYTLRRRVNQKRGERDE